MIQNSMEENSGIIFHRGRSSLTHSLSRSLHGRRQKHKPLPILTKQDARIPPSRCTRSHLFPAKPSSYPASLDATTHLSSSGVHSKAIRRPCYTFNVFVNSAARDPARGNLKEYLIHPVNCLEYAITGQGPLSSALTPLLMT